MKEMMFESGIEPFEILQLFDEKSQKMKIDPRHLVVSILGMVIFPVAGRPLLQMVYFNNDEAAYNGFLEERRIIIKNMIIKILEL
jgi:preprotein translocase subunit Sec61beta